MMMHPTERVLNALKGEPTDRPPFICPGGMLNMLTVEAMQSLSAAWPQCHCDAGEMSRLALGVRALAGIENIGVPYCMTVEAEAMGAKVCLGSLESEARVIGYPLDDLKQFESLPCLSRGSTRLTSVQEAIEILHAADQPYPIIANLTGPVSLATSLIEPMIFYKAMGKDPALVHAFMVFLSENLIAFGRKMLLAGAQILTISDPSATGEILGPRRFAEFVLPYLNRILDGLQDHYAASLVHICGNLKTVFPELLELHTTAISIDSATSISAMQKVLTDQKVIVGNVSTHLLMNGAPDRVQRASLSCLRRGARVLSPACGISPYTPLANMQAMAASVLAWDALEQE